MTLHQRENEDIQNYSPLSTSLVDYTADNLTLCLSLHRRGPVEQKGDWNHCTVKAKSFSQGRVEPVLAEILCKCSNNAHDFFPFLKLWTLMNFLFPQAFWGQKVGQNIKLKAMIKERIQPAMRRQHKESQDGVNNAHTSQKHWYNFPFSRGKIQHIAKMHKWENAVTTRGQSGYSHDLCMLSM